MATIGRIVTGLALAGLILTGLAGNAWAKGKPIKVFLLVGQSNMQGKGAATHIESLLADPDTPADERELFAPLMKDGKHVVRKDVWIWYIDKAGDLTVGYGSGKDVSFGPELGIGRVLGDHFDEQVLLIKCAWGGKSLKRDFRPPSMPPTQEELEAALESAKKKNPDATMEEVKESYGHYYRETLRMTKDVLANLKTHFPSYAGQDYEIAGLIWFQGWNDLVGSGNQDYGKQMAAFIRDIRKDLKVPNLPVVIGESGHNGPISPEKKGGGMDIVRQGQEAPSKMPEFKGTVAFTKTHQFFDPKLGEMAALYSDCKRAVYVEEMKRLKALGYKSKKELSELPREKRKEIQSKYQLSDEEKEKIWQPWKKVQPVWSKVAADAGYHFYGSGKIFYKMGHAFGEDMVKLIEGQQ